MAHFNLLTEPWIRVISDSPGHVEEVSMLDVFRKAPDYLGLAGETDAQDFAVLRLLLAVLHTVFSRFDAQGEAYPMVSLDDHYLPIKSIDPYDADDYYALLEETWFDLWEQGSFPSIVEEYLQAWFDHFYLFSETYPFYQVTAEDLSKFNLKRYNYPNYSGKNFNRIISESNNKVALFSPKYANGQNKELLTAPEIARWLVAFQGYIGLADKASFDRGEKYKSSKGWLFDLGGIYIQGNTLWETLMLNFAISHGETLNLEYLPQEVPSWELSGKEIINRRFVSPIVDNLAELYTLPGRAVFIDPEADTSQPFTMGILKIPEVNHQGAFIEPMTLWRWNESGDNKGTFTPTKHKADALLWQSFNVIALDGVNQHKPGIMDWLDRIGDDIDFPLITLRSISLQDDGNATSWVPTDDISDELRLKGQLLFDEGAEKWTVRIKEEVQLIKRLVGFDLRTFAKDLNKIRSSQNDGFVNRVVQETYFAVDQPFRDWLISLDPTDSAEDKIRKWRDRLYEILWSQANDLVKNAGKRDYLGKTIKRNENDKGCFMNIAIAYNKFIHRLKEGVKGK